MSEELKPVRCGCGGEAQTGKSYSGFYCVECMNCGMQSGYYDTESEAITAWNWAMGAKDINVPNKERKKGKWIYDKTGYDFWTCSACGFVSEAFSANILYYFCPNCGADMRGE